MCCPENTVMEKKTVTQDPSIFCNHISVLRKKEELTHILSELQKEESKRVVSRKNKETDGDR